MKPPETNNKLKRCYARLRNQMQTRVDAEFVVLFKADVKSQDIRNTRYRTADKRVVKYKG